VHYNLIKGCDDMSISEIEHYTSVLFDSYLSNKGLNHIVKVASEMLKNPVIVINSSYKILAYSDEEKVNDEIWRGNIKQGFCSYEFITSVRNLSSVQQGLEKDEVYEVECPESPNKKLICKIKVNNKHIGNIILLQCENEFSYYDEKLLSITSRVIGEEMKKSDMYRNTNNTLYDELIYDILDNNLTKRELKKRLQVSEFQFSKEIYVLVFDISNYDSKGKSFSYLHDRFQSFFYVDNSVYYNNNIIFIWDKNIENMSNEYKNKMNKFLKDSCIRLGISKVFHDILDCKKYYEQGVKALNIGKLVYPEALSISYDSILIYELIDSNPKMSFEDFKNTTLEKLKAYDYEKNTDLYKTLLVYLKNNKSIQHSAEELFIHRNTMRIRLQKIFELTDVNFNNVEEIFNIYLAYKVNEFVNKSNGAF